MFDYVVIGSGFGGSVMSLRLVEKGYRVCLLERGRQWGINSFPRRINEIKKNLFWDPDDHMLGVMEIRDSPESDVMTVTASGLGGGSLVYANVLMKPQESVFAGWPDGYCIETLEPYFEKVLSMLEAQPLDKSSSYNTRRSDFFKSALPYLKRQEDEYDIELLDPQLAVRFEGAFQGAQSTNQHGALQSSCNRCGECDIGCNSHAKNTLDLTYLTRASNKELFEYPLEVRTQHEVISIQADQEFYRLSVLNRFSGEIEKIETKKVVLSAGSVGSTELLLRMKVSGALPKLNDQLGTKWCGNGDLEGTIIGSDFELDPTEGPVITSAFKFTGGSYPDGFSHNFYIQDAAMPIGLMWYLSGKNILASKWKSQLRLGLHFLISSIFKIFAFFGFNFLRLNQSIGNKFAKAIDSESILSRSLVLLGMGRDRSDGRVGLDSNGRAIIKWSLKNSEFHYEKVRSRMKRLARFANGVYIENPLSFLKKVVAVHPLGGCPMGNNPEDSLVRANGESWDYPGLYVVDASIFPTSIGPNPSLTIAAVAEKIADEIPHVDQVYKFT